MSANEGFNKLYHTLVAHERHKRWLKYLKNSSGLLGFATKDVYTVRQNLLQMSFFLQGVSVSVPSSALKAPDLASGSSS